LAGFPNKEILFQSPAYSLLLAAIHQIYIQWLIPADFPAGILLLKSIPDYSSGIQSIRMYRE